ncbi:hypothetical protein NEMBOFW57_003728 [Staphylotrichum longicolle]|uniref:Uncharacterized protein n=1 Tax=Staphylotrichum longicolle TaxID=669026 RepID=A0AAD4I622_9PEZI|nr:hypothetical protein NEMBOFW57_003728 [Staphylotrichum longicolle]
MAAAGPARKRSRTFEASYDGAGDDEGHSKGGHSLRKRARIDYTQEMIDDDLGVPAAKNELVVVKPAATPSARARKRKVGHEESDDESEDFTANPKRHRTDKSPAPSRALPPRRRNPSKKLSTDLSTYVDQLSDNEVQDTILVSVPAGLVAPSEDGSDHSSFRDPESSPSASDEGETARPDVQSPTAHMQLQQSIEDAVPVAAQDDAAAGIHDEPEQADDKSHILASQPSLTPAAAIVQPQQIHENETSDAGLVLPTIVQEPESINPQDFEVPMIDAGPSEQSPHQPEQRDSSSQGEAPQPSVEISEPTTAPAPEQKLEDDSAMALVHRAATGKPTAPPAPSQQEAKSTGPARLKQLDRIYDPSQAPFASHLNLNPYEDEDVPLPGPYTEWVYPVAPVKDQSTPILVPTPVPSLPVAEKKPAEAGWDMRRPLKTSEFFALYSKESKRRQEKGEPPISMTEFNNECVRRYKSVHTDDGTSAVTSVTTNLTNGSSTRVAEQLARPAMRPVEEETPQDSQVTESRLPSAAASPAPIDDALAQDDAAEDEQDVDEPIDDQTKPNSPGEPVEVTRNPRKQYLFPKIRDSNEFAEAFEGWQDFSTDHLYEVVAAGVEALHAYQQEYNELKKYLDDEENAKRRRAYDKTLSNWEKRQKYDEPLPWRRNFDEPVKGGAPTFEVRGVRAPKPYIDDASLEHQKEEDRIMAQTYGFKLNTHPTQVGRQNPEEQRWEMAENRLRKRTEKAAELAEENVVEGKRARKPRQIADKSKDPSRAGTPTGTSAYAPARRQRRNGLAATAANGDENDALNQAQFADSFSESPRKGRAARARGVVLPYDPQQITSVAEKDNNGTEDEEVDVDEKPKVPRRRGRGAATLPEPPTSVPTATAKKAKRLRGGKGQLGNQLEGGEIASSSFYSLASTQPDSRPSTASSAASAHTAETAESTYSLRDKRKRNFALENDPELEARPQRRVRGAAAKKQEPAEPKRRGPKRKETATEPPPPPPASAPSPPPVLASPAPHLQQLPATKFYHNFVAGPMMVDTGNNPQPVLSHAAGPFLHTFNAAPAFPPGAPPPPPPPPSVKKPITKIKLTNNGASSSPGSSRAETPANGSSGAKSGGKRVRGKKAASMNEAKAAAAANGDGDLDKPYAEMTKSEKMSWSMRRRWASGEMQGAVEKRRTTLAIKKAEKAAGNGGPEDSEVGAMGQMTDSGSAGPSDPTTPASMYGQPGPGPLAFPQGPAMPMPLAPPPQGYLQQPPYPYAMPPGPMGPMP